MLSNRLSRPPARWRRSADTEDLLKPPTFFTRPVPGMDVLLDGADLGRDRRVLASKNGKAQARCRWDAIILLIGENLDQLCRTVAALGRDDPQLSQMPADRVRQHRALNAPG